MMNIPVRVQSKIVPALLLIACYFTINLNSSCYAWSITYSKTSRAPPNLGKHTTSTSTTSSSTNTVCSYYNSGGIRRSQFSVLNQQENENNEELSQKEEEPNENEKKQTQQKMKAGKEYKPPTFSKSFLAYREQVRQKAGISSDQEGVDCTGEPSVDPSRMVQDDGLDSEYLDDFN